MLTCCPVILELVTIHEDPQKDGETRIFNLDGEKNLLLISRHSKKIEEKHSPNCKFTYYECPVMSREHAEFRVDIKDGRVWLTDGGARDEHGVPLGSMHGTYVNDERLVPGEEYPMRNEDIITFGSTVNTAKG
jgi:pSer/pThr/pTyr-binding forkhead associated (FHA) protein